MAIESVSGNTVNAVLPAKSGTKDAADVKQKSPVAVPADAVNFTHTAQQFKLAVESSPVTPVVNEDRVAAIKLALQAGSYKVDAEHVAEKMLRFEDKLPDST
ncbi:MAG: flagellar biosynthesis anti-sigma factor FlgM [Methylomonas sp.]